MTLPSPLFIARENFADSLQDCLEGVSAQQGPEAETISETALRYHLLGIALLLGEADRRGFTALLALSGQADCDLRLFDLSTQPLLLAASRAVPFSDALAAGDLESARTIARLAPDNHLDGWEYEDDFLAAHFQHRMLLAPDDEPALARLLERWEKVLEGKPSPQLDASKALLARDAPTFEAALLDMVRERENKLDAWRKTPTYDEELDATEGQLFVQGLAAIRLAELRGLTMAKDYPLMPSLARVPMGAQLPPPGSWRDSSFAMAFL